MFWFPLTLNSLCNFWPVPRQCGSSLKMLNYYKVESFIFTAGLTKLKHLVIPYTKPPTLQKSIHEQAVAPEGKQVAGTLTFIPNDRHLQLVSKPMGTVCHHNRWYIKSFYTFSIPEITTRTQPAFSSNVILLTMFLYHISSPCLHTIEKSRQSCSWFKYIFVDLIHIHITEDRRNSKINLLHLQVYYLSIISWSKIQVYNS